MVSVTDAHVHVVSSDRGRFPLRPLGVGRDWWTGRAVDAERITADLDAAGVHHAVIVQAVGPYGNDNRYARHAVSQEQDRFALVVAIDTEGTDPAAELVAQYGPDVAGVRAAAFTGDAPWLTDGRGAAVWDAAADCATNLVVACLAPNLAGVAHRVRARSDVPVALDHCAFPDLTGGPPYRRAGSLFDLADVPAVHLKISTMLLRDAEAHGGARAFVEHVVNRFGATRVCWGSDHPQSFELEYEEMLQLALEATVGLGATARAAVLHDTARALWFGAR